MKAVLPIYRFGNRVIVGTTRCGKSTAEVLDIIAAAMLGMAIVVIDPHMMSLAWNAFVHLSARGFRRRILFDQLSCLSHVLGYRFLRRSKAREPLRRDAENEQSIREFMDVIGRRRDVQSFAKHPLTEDFLFDASALILYQAAEQPTSDIQFAFQPKHKRFRELVRHCTRDDIRSKFEGIADGSIKHGQYASAARLIRGVCASPAFTTRCRPTFDLSRFLDGGGILLVEGASQGVSQDAANMIMGSIVLQVIQYVRGRTSSKPGVLLVLDEATNASLIGSAGHETRALAELQKKRLDIHALVQSPNFPSSQIEEGVFTNCIEHHWFFNANESVCQQAARDLGDADYRERVRYLKRGERFIRRLGRVSFDRVTPLPDPWVLPGLSTRKAYKSLAEIRNRPEYWSPTQCPEPESEPTTETLIDLPLISKSNNSPSVTSSSPGTSLPSSPAERLNTGRSRDSSGPDGCVESASSS